MTTPSDSLLAHWRFQKDCANATATDLATVIHGITLEPASHPRFRTAARFNGAGDHLAVESHPALAFGAGDFSTALWLETDALTDVVGDLISKYDDSRRQGWGLSVVTNTGSTTTTAANYRHVHFGIDQARNDPLWTSCGRPGQAMFIYALASIEGHLYVGTFEAGADERGHLWRYLGGEEWEDLGASPDGANCISSIAFFDGALHVSSTRYYTTGSAIAPTLNANPGGNVYRIGADGVWTSIGNPGLCGAKPEDGTFTGYEAGETDLADDTGSLTVYQGHLYATSYHRRRGVYRYLGGGEWEPIGPAERVMSMAVYRGHLHILANGGAIFRYEGGRNWRNLGTPEGSTQNYAVAIHRGQFLTGTWPECELFSYEGGTRWKKIGLVGYEREVMALSLYNQKVYLGTLPMAHGWRLDGNRFTFIGNADSSPEYPLRRLWSMAVHGGRLYAGTLPSGRVLSYEAGKSATSDRALPPGWHHLAAVRRGGQLALWLDGQLWAESTAFDASAYATDNASPLLIGFGAHEYFRGNMADLRLYGRALDAGEIARLASLE